jgi:hypothetical protein
MQSQPDKHGTLLSDITSEQLHWLWEKRIPRGKLTTLDGDPGLGKSLLTNSLPKHHPFTTMLLHPLHLLLLLLCPSLLIPQVSHNRPNLANCPKRRVDGDCYRSKRTSSP